MMHMLKRVLVWGVICGWLWGPRGAIAESPRNEQAIAEVLAGKRTEARAAWWGFDAIEATGALQAAIDSGAAKVVVESMPSPWIVDKIRLASHQELVFEPGVVVQAKRGAFHGKTDSLFSAWNQTDIRLTGYGATLQMHRADYDGPDYAKAEWRHVLSFRGCTNVTVLGLTLAESGGDGIYLGTGRGGETNRNVVIRDVVCDRNYRQGISVITAENLLIENCLLKNTAGTAPAAGIDFEPNRASERLVDCVMRNCIIENNQGYGIHIYARPLDATSKPISIRIENCVTRGTNARSLSIVTSSGEAGAVKGKIELINCRFEDEGHAGIRIGSKPPDGVRVRLVGCTLADPSDRPVPAAPIVFSSRRGDLENIGGVEFVDCTIRERVERPVMTFDDATGSRLLDVTGSLTVERQGERTVYALDQEQIDRWVPYDPIVEIPTLAVNDLQFQPVAPREPPARRSLPAHRLRSAATYLLYAAEEETVAIGLKHQRVGRSDGPPLPVVVLDPAGHEVARIAVPLDDEAVCRFTAEATGVFRIVSRPGRHTLRIDASSHPVCIAGDGPLVHLLGTTGEFYLWVPAEVREFGLRFHGEGEAERFSVALFDAAGQLRWEQSDIGPAESFRVERAATEQGEPWRLRLSRPDIGVLEDIHLEFRGLPPVLGFRPQDLLRP